MGSTGISKITGALYRFARPIFVFIIIIGFFVYYNIFRIDHTLENLKFSLEQTAVAYDIVDINGLDMILNQAVASEVSPSTINAFDMANLEYVSNIVKTGAHFQQLDSMKTGLTAAINEREKRRGTFLRIIDTINRPLRKLLFYVYNIPRYLISKRKAQIESVTEVADIGLLQKIRAIEMSGNPQAAVGEYQKLIQEYAGTDKVALLKLRLGYIYHRLGKYDDCLPIYREIVETTYPRREAQIAQVLIDSLKQKDALLREADDLIIKVNETPETDLGARQEIFYRLGTIYTQLFDLTQASMFYKRVISIDPSSELAKKVQFNLAWLLKQQYKFEESLKGFYTIIEKGPGGELLLGSHYQVADIYRFQGKFKESIAILEGIADQYEDQLIAALCLFRVADSYLHDLKDPLKAKEVIERLQKKHPESIYTQFFKPEEEPIRMFVTYVVPRATRVITWKVAGLFCISGYFGELGRGLMTAKEPGINTSVNAWCAEEFPDTLGNIYFDLRGVEIILKDEAIRASGRVTFGKFSIMAESEFTLETKKNGDLEMTLTKVFLNKIPIPPVFLNNTIKNLLTLLNKYFPIVIAKVSTKEGIVDIEGYAGTRMLKRINESTQTRLAAETAIEELQDIGEGGKIYALFEERFPESDFTPFPKYNIEELFLDFVTRMLFYTGFKLLETVKDTKFDYRRSIRTLGRLEIEEGNFRINYTEAYVNENISSFIKEEFPWLVNSKFLFDVVNINFDFKDNGDIEIEGDIGLGYKQESDLNVGAHGVHLEGTVVFDIDEETKIPRPLFKEIKLNGEVFPTRKLDLVILRVIALLKDAGFPLKMEKIEPYEDGIILKGRSPKDYTNRLFGEGTFLQIFHIRTVDLGLAGVERLQDLPPDYQDYRARTFNRF
jgi:tetratricopeptide (TPR) repeat protein